MSTSSNNPVGGDDGPSGNDGAGGDAVAAPMELNVEDRQAPEGERANKAPRISVINHCESMDRFHADEVLVPEFPNDILDNLQDYDLRFCKESDPMDDMWDDNGDEVIKTSNIPEELWFPFAEQEPLLAGGALESLDEIGDSYEINRSRWVAREYTWLDPEKEITFAP
ncbi:unnamed protein product, partial [Symbiodinium pilosum]